MIDLLSVNNTAIMRKNQAFFRIGKLFKKIRFSIDLNTKSEN